MELRGPCDADELDKAQLEQLITREKEDRGASTLGEAREKWSREREHNKHCVQMDV